MGDVVEVGGLLGVAGFTEALRRKGVSVCRQAVWRWVKQGRLDGVMIGNKWYVRESEVRRVLLLGLPGEKRDQWSGVGDRLEEGEKRFTTEARRHGEGGRGEERGGDVVSRARVRMGGRGGAEAFCRLHGL